MSDIDPDHNPDSPDLIEHSEKVPNSAALTQVEAIARGYGFEDITSNNLLNLDGLRVDELVMGGFRLLVHEGSNFKIENGESYKDALIERYKGYTEQSDIKLVSSIVIIKPSLETGANFIRNGNKIFTAYKGTKKEFKGSLLLVEGNNDVQSFAMIMVRGIMRLANLMTYTYNEENFSTQLAEGAKFVLEQAKGRMQES